MATQGPKFLFVHGAWHNKSTWHRITPLLEAKGFVTRAIDLPGAGANAKSPESFFRRPFDAGAFATELSPNAGVTQSDRTAAVIAEIDALGGDVVLVGHSLGGLTVSSVAEAASEKLRAAVYLTAFMLPPGTPAIAMIQHETMAAAMVPGLLRADPTAVGALRLDVASRNPDCRDGVHQCFYGDVTIGDFEAFTESLHCDEPAGVCLEASPVTPDRYGRGRRVYIRCLQDRAITIEGQDFMRQAMDRAMGSETEVLTLDASHSPFLSQPDILAEALLGLAR